MTDVAKPVSLSAASRAHRSFTAVMTMRAARIGNASANVSSISTPFTCMSARPTRRRMVDQRHWCVAQFTHLVIRESHGGITVEVAGEIACDGRIEPRLDVQASPERCATQLAFLDDERAGFHDVARRREHRGAVRV